MILGEDSYGHSGDKYFWPLSYSSAKTAQKRMDKLEKAGIRCKLTGYNGGCIEFLSYNPETEALLEKERQEVIIAHRAWQAKQVQTGQHKKSYRSPIDFYMILRDNRTDYHTVR